MVAMYYSLRADRFFVAKALRARRVMEIEPGPFVVGRGPAAKKKGCRTHTAPLIIVAMWAALV